MHFYLQFGVKHYEKYISYLYFSLFIFSFIKICEIILRRGLTEADRLRNTVLKICLIIFIFNLIYKLVSNNLIIKKLPRKSSQLYFIKSSRYSNQTQELQP